MGCGIIQLTQIGGEFGFDVDREADSACREILIISLKSSVI